MAAETYYAWSEVRYGTDDKGRVQSLKYGDPVTAAKLGIDADVADAEMASLVESGAIRTEKPPEMPDTWRGSPREWYLEQLRLVSEGPELAVMSNAGSYFGPSPEELLAENLAQAQKASSSKPAAGSSE